MDITPAIKTLLHAWGSETPQEVYWGLNELADIVSNNPIHLPEPLYNQENDDEYNKVYDDFINQFKNI